MGIDVVLIYFRFLIFIMRLCKFVVTNADSYAYFGCSKFGRHKFESSFESSLDCQVFMNIAGLFIILIVWSSADSAFSSVDDG